LQVLLKAEERPFPRVVGAHGRQMVGYEGMTYHLILVGGNTNWLSL